MNPGSTIVFVCEHGAAKSILAATCFNKFAGELGLNLRAIARGTHPEAELSPQLITGLAGDGLVPVEFIPQKLTRSDLQSARRLVAFCELTENFQQPVAIEYWHDVPHISENYENARDIIIKHIRDLLGSIG